MAGMWSSLPPMALAIPVPQAAAILMPLLLVMDVMGLALMPLAPLGVWIGGRIARRISPQLFYRFVLWGMFLTGCKLLWDGFQ